MMRTAGGRRADRDRTREERLRRLRAAARRARRQAGQASIEFAGILIVVALLMASAIAATAPILGPRIAYSICLAYKDGTKRMGVNLDTLCAQYIAKNLPQCTTYRQDRILGADGTFMFIRADRDGTDQIYVTKDPVTGKEKAYVILGGNTDAGVGGGWEGGPFKLDGKATIGGGTGTVYEFNSQKEAQDFLDSRRGNVGTRILGALTGGVADGIYDSIKGLWGDDGPKPSGVTVNMSVQAEGGLNAEKGIKGVEFGAKLGAEGKQEGQFRYNKDGTSQLSVTWSGNVSGELGAKSAKELPILGKLGFGGGGTLSGSIGYRINFDKDGKPSTLTVTTEHGTQSDFKAGSSAADVKGSDGQLTMNTYTLDLTTPSGMKAFKDTLPELAAGSVNPVSAVALFGTDNPLTQELFKNATQMQQTYATQGDQTAGNAPKEDDNFGLKIGPFGLGFTDSTAKRTLTGARIKPPGGEWEDLAKCK